MGLMRKALSVHTLGLVPMNDKKTRLSKKQLAELRKQTAALEAIARGGPARVPTKGPEDRSGPDLTPEGIAARRAAKGRKH